jgi:hypothetical protein
VNICTRAQADGFIIHQNVLASIYRQRVANNHDSIKQILSNYTFHQLKILMRVLHLVGPGSTFVHTLYNYRIISYNITLLRLKDDLVTVLMYYYLNHPPPNYNNTNNNLIVEPAKLNILSFHEENIDESSSSHLFDCPICMESKETIEKVICNCNHEICKTCMDNYLKHFIAKNNPSAIKPSCSLCRTNITSITLHNNTYKEELSNKYFV